MKELRKEICKLILAKIGMVPPPNFGKTGITTKEFLLDKTINIEFEDELGNVFLEKFGLWCGILKHQGMQVRVVATDICNNKNSYHEFLATYCVDKSPIHGTKAVYGAEDYGLFIIKTPAGWKQVGVYEMLVGAAGFEKMSSIGLLWEPCDEYEDLFIALKEIVNMG
jgi:hypothetical protein